VSEISAALQLKEKQQQKQQRHLKRLVDIFVLYSIDEFLQLLRRMAHKGK